MSGYAESPEEVMLRKGHLAKIFGGSLEVGKGLYNLSSEVLVQELKNTKYDLIIQ